MHQNQNKYKSEPLHIPVLLNEVLAILAPQSGESYLDLTAGYGGHARAVLDRTGNPDGAVLIDRDPKAIAVLQQTFQNSAVELQQADFWTASQQLAQQGRLFDLILADIGVSSPHLNESNRGFSLQSDGPLDMRMDQSQQLSAETVVNSWPEAELARILRQYGEEPKAKQIAQLIVRNRPVTSTTQLAALAAKAWPGHSRVHPATRTFQALRIVINDELGQLERSLPIWQDILAPGGRLAIISFHSLEDRLIKQYLSEHAGERYDTDLRSLSKRPITAKPSELVFNPRARSAKLRAAVKINNKKERGTNANPGKK